MFDWNMGKQFKSRLPSAEEALPGRANPISVKSLHYVLNAELLPPYAEGVEVAYFGMGCFWGAEKLFWGLPGVYTTVVGYGAGITPNPTYEEVCSGRTGHNELVKVVYWPDKIGFNELLKIFWQNHNPCEGMRQGNDIGTQYRSGIYVTSPSQLDTAQKSKDIYDKVLEAQNKSLSTTEIQDEFQFYIAEEYHQQYLAKNPGGYCPNHSCEYTGLPPFPGVDS